MEHEHVDKEEERDASVPQSSNYSQMDCDDDNGAGVNTFTSTSTSGSGNGETVNSNVSEQESTSRPAAVSCNTTATPVVATDDSSYVEMSVATITEPHNNHATERMTQHHMDVSDPAPPQDANVIVPESSSSAHTSTQPSWEQTVSADAPENRSTRDETSQVSPSIEPQIPDTNTSNYQYTNQPINETQTTDINTFSSQQVEQQQDVHSFIGPQIPGEALSTNQQPSPPSFIGPQIPDNYSKPQTQPSAIIQEPLDLKYSFSPSCPMQCVDQTSSMFMKNDQENYLRGCKWSPDGTQVLTNSNDNILRTFTPGHGMHEDNTDGAQLEMVPSPVIKESGIVYDFSWFPGMDSSKPETCRVACSCPGSPMHLWDSENGRLLSSYRAFDHCDEVTSAYSLSFSPDGSQLFGGYKNSIRIFDTEYSHRQCSMIKTLNPKTKEGHTGIISCFSHGAAGSNTFVTGSYSKYVGVYYTLTNELVCLIQGQQGGVTHVMMSPDGNRLYTGGRKDPEIICWDMRNTGQVLSTFLRDVQTNQRIYFDMSSSGRYLVSGNHDGSVQVWDTWEAGHQVDGEVIMKPCYAFQAHRDCTNGVSFNQHRPLLATASGQRHFKDFDDDDSTDSDNDNDDGKEANATSKTQRPDPREFSLKIWNIPCLS